jgi:hypothetical protein
MSDNTFLFEYETKGLIVSYDYEDKSNKYSTRLIKQCCLLDKHTFKVSALMYELNKNFNQKVPVNKNDIFASISGLYSLNYLKIQNENDFFYPKIKISSTSIGDSGKTIYLQIEDTQQTLDSYLLNHFLGKEVAIHYAQTNSQELMQKFLLEQTILDLNKSNKSFKL